MNSLNSEGCPLHSSSRLVSSFFFLILLYFSFLVLPGNPCHGRLPLRKYRRTWPIVSRSSLLDCSKNIIKMELCHTYSFMGVNTGVPSCSGEILSISVRYVLAVWIFVLFSQAKVNDEYAILVSVIAPIKKLSCLMSLWIIFSSWTF